MLQGTFERILPSYCMDMGVLRSHWESGCVHKLFRLENAHTGFLNNCHVTGQVHPGQLYYLHTLHLFGPDGYLLPY